jgi:hypothetical protein
MDVIARLLIGRRRNQAQIGADQAQVILLLLALGVGHHDDRAIAQRVADQGQTDAGVAGRALDDGAARLQPAGGDRVLDDGQRRAILDRSAGIEEFGLAQDLAAGRGRGARQTDERRVADGIDEAVADGH